VTTQDKLSIYIMELQKTASAYTPFPLIQHIPRLNHYVKGEPADVHELLIAVINDMSENTTHLFQGRMSSTVKCSLCEHITSRTDNTQEIFIQINKNMNLSVEDSFHDFFEPEILEGDNAYWYDTCKKKRRATKTLSITRTPTILILHLKRLIIREKIQTHTASGTTLDLGPYMTLEPSQPQRTQLPGVISHHGTNDSGHYTAITKREENWTLFNGTSDTHIPTQKVLQTQAYILLYRNPDPIAKPKETEQRDRPL